MRNTQQLFLWLFLAIFSTSFISCIDNSETETNIPKAENLPGTLTYTENGTKRFISPRDSVSVKYIVNSNAMIITAENAKVKEDTNSSKQTLTFVIKNITTLSDLDSTILTTVSTNAAGLPIPFVEIKQFSNGPGTISYDTKSITAKLDIRKAGGGKLEAYFESYLEGGISPDIAKTKLTKGVIHRASIYYD